MKFAQYTIPMMLLTVMLRITSKHDITHIIDVINDKSTHSTLKSAELIGKIRYYMPLIRI
ncbi:hypothetical protein JK628_09650 [Shewanella sp. KX20019]|uniref:hypothetical protein n=1 Tax=Shewanella sp. KX20019 TaxID=2803864 RepID=UPI001928A742|nr:hypothetical protein [Shewanella sp. KX20019]QQX82043.1 hypothetical protein JK628_09650 [Shewanella sp. KX20019]